VELYQKPRDIQVFRKKKSEKPKNSHHNFVFGSLAYTVAMQDTLRALVQDFFTKMGISYEMVSFSCQDEEAHIYEAKIKTPDSKIVIGIHGQTLDYVKHLLSRMGERITGKHCTIHVEVNDYLKNKDDRLHRYLDAKISEVQGTKKSIVLNQLTSYERKKAHDYIASKHLSGISAHSEGEGNERRLHIDFDAKIITFDISEDGI
jgi:predicted RNA-binding protein Jag